MTTNTNAMNGPKAQTHRQYKCVLNDCKEWFSRSEEVTKHMERYHNLIQCPECELRFLTNELLSTHMSKDHKPIRPTRAVNRNVAQQCANCEFKCFSMALLHKHMRSHSNVLLTKHKNKSIHKNTVNRDSKQRDSQSASRSTTQVLLNIASDDESEQMDSQSDSRSSIQVLLKNSSDEEREQMDSKSDIQIIEIKSNGGSGERHPIRTTGATHRPLSCNFCDFKCFSIEILVKHMRSHSNILLTKANNNNSVHMYSKQMDSQSDSDSNIEVMLIRNDSNEQMDRQSDSNCRPNEELSKNTIKIRRISPKIHSSVQTIAAKDELIMRAKPNPKPKQYKCLLNDCKECFNDSKEVKQHMESTHNLIKCQKCEQRFLTNELLSTHMIKVHNKALNCNKCQFRCYSLATLHKHKRCHTKVLTTFKTKNTIHMNSKQKNGQSDSDAVKHMRLNERNSSSDPKESSLGKGHPIGKQLKEVIINLSHYFSQKHPNWSEYRVTEELSDSTKVGFSSIKRILGEYKKYNQVFEPKEKVGKEKKFTFNANDKQMIESIVNRLKAKNSFTTINDIYNEINSSNDLNLSFKGCSRNTFYRLFPDMGFALSVQKNRQIIVRKGNNFKNKREMKANIDLNIRDDIQTEEEVMKN